MTDTSTAPDPEAWLAGGGAMGERIRAHDWAATPLGPPSAWPEPLRAALSLCLSSVFPTAVYWGPELRLLYNDAWAPIPADRHPWALGRPAAEVWADIWTVVGPQFDGVLRRGEGVSAFDQWLPMQRGGRPAETYWTYSLTPIRDGAGAVRGVLNQGHEVTARVLGERRDRFLLALGDRLRGLSEPRAVVEAAQEALGRHLGASRVGYGEVDASERHFTTTGNWTDGTVPSRSGGHDLAAFGPEVWGALRRGEPLLIADVGDDPRTAAPEARAAFEAIDTRAAITASLVRGGRMRAALYVHAREAKAWTEGDAALVSEVALRTWEAAERARAEERLQLATEAADLGIFDVDLVTERMDWDARQRRLWGVGPEEAITDGTFIEGVHPEDRERVRAAVARALDPGGDRLYAEEYRIRPRPGDAGWRWIAATGRVHFDAGRPVRLVGTVQDVSARKAAELALRGLNETLESRVAAALAERNLLAEVFEGTHALLAVAGPDLRLLAFNRAYADEVERLGGHRPRVGERVTAIYAEGSDLARSAERNWARAVGGAVFTVTEELGDPARHRRWYERRFETLRDREGRVAGAYQFATDVTERRRDQRRADEAEEARRASDALYRAYFQASGEALFVVAVRPDGGFAFEEANPTHRAALGFDVAAHRGRPIEAVLPPEVAAAVAANYRRVLETGQIQRYRETAEIGGRTIHAETVLVPVRDSQGRIVRIVGSGRDMTAQVEAEEALRQSQKMEAMGQLTGGVAHDFNNLLTPILGALDRLQRGGAGTPRERRLVEGALESAERARTLVSRLLAFARRQPLQPRPVDVGELVAGMAGLLGSTIGPQVRLAVDAAPGLPPALADANQIEMAVLNLAVNARDAMPEGGALRIRVEAATRAEGEAPGPAAPGRYVRLLVEDTGVGMDEATLARAVEPFFSTKGVGRGTGLGLSMVHGLAAQLGGALELRSRPGEGTAVSLWLPVAEGAAEGEATGEGAGEATGPDRVEDAEAPGGGAGRPAAADGRPRGTVLLVDDEALVRAAAADMLSELGWRVVEAASAEEALSLAEAGLAPDLLLTDHLMPGMTGTELARRLRARDPALLVLVVSGYAEAEGIPADLPRLAKPFRRADLAARLRAVAPPDPA